MKIYLLPILLAACEFSAPDVTPSEPADPIGTWRVNLTYSPGNCGLSGSGEIFRSVVASPSGNLVDVVTGRPKYQISGGNPNAVISGSVTCEVDQCRLAFIEDTLGGTANTRFQGQWTVDAAGTIQGTGNSSGATANMTCSQNWVVSGNLE